MFTPFFTFIKPHLVKLTPSWGQIGVVLWFVVLVLVWKDGPELNVGEYTPLKPLWGRVVFTLLWLWLILGIFSWRLWQRIQRQSAAQHAQEQRKADPHKALIEAQADKLQALHEHHDGEVHEAKPWYLVLGRADSGKSSFVRQAFAGSRFNPPLAADLPDDAAALLVDSWMGEQAVVLDPKRAVLSQLDAEEERLDNGGERLWQHLLQWIAKHRRRQPLNGVVLTIDLAWLSGAKAAECKKYAQWMRARLQEVTSTLDASLPLYVVLTKLDSLHGFDLVYQQQSRAVRESVLGVTFSPHSGDGKRWLGELDAFWEQWLARLNDNLPQLMLTHPDTAQRSALFTFVRQLAGARAQVLALLGEVIDAEEQRPLMVRGVYMSSTCQQGGIVDAFSSAVEHRYQLPDTVQLLQRGASTPFFVKRLFSNIIIPEAHLAGDNLQYVQSRHRQMAIGVGALCLCAGLSIGGWHYFYQVNEAAGSNVLAKAQAFTDANELTGQQGLGFNQLPRLNLIRDAALSFGNYRERMPLVADFGLYQGDEIGPYVEETYLQLLSMRFLPAVMQGLLEDLEQAPTGSEEQLTVLRVMRMLDAAEGRDKHLVEQYMASRWQQAFPAQGETQEQLMGHLDYVLQHTDWYGARQAKDSSAIAAFVPFQSSMLEAQRELGKLPMFQRVYQSLVVKAGEELQPALAIRDEVGPTFDAVFALRRADAGLVPRLHTWSGFNEFFIKQDKSLLDLTSMDAWVLGQRKQPHLSDADHKEIFRQINDRYVTDYVNQWQSLLTNLDIQTLKSPEQALDVLTAITGNEQPFLRVLAALDDNTRIRKLSDVEGEPAQAIVARIGRPFMATNAALVGRGEQGPLIQEVNQKLVELQHYLELIVNATEPGQSALNAVQQRLTNKYADPVFALQQYARGLPAPLDRWVDQIAEQSSQLVVGLAMSSLNQAWQDKVLVPFNRQLAGRYPFEPRSSKDVPLSEMERFFAPGGTLDNFYQVNLKPMVESGLMEGSPVQAELVKQLDRAARIRQIFFSQQGNLEVQFALEPIELSANKRRSVLNLDGQLLEYAHGRRTKIPLVWPNTMRDGAESKITLVSAVRDHSPRSEGFVGPWAMFRLLDKGDLTQVREGSFDVRFQVAEGAMTYRVHTDSAQSPFTGGLFSQFRLPDTLY